VGKTKTESEKKYSVISHQTDLIWACSKAMLTLTASQLQTYQIDCSRFSAQATKLYQEFEVYMT